MSAHGTNGGYYQGCREECCRAAHAAYRRSVWRKRYVRGVERLYIDATGTRRRVRALQALGWRFIDIDRAAGRNPASPNATWSHNLVRQSKVHVDNAALLAAAYEVLSMRPADGLYAARTRKHAARMGYAPPLAWDDIDADLEPYVGHDRLDHDEIDPVVVERFMAGEWHIAATRAERVEITTRWVARGRSLKQLENATGWRTERYVTRQEGAA